MSHIVMCILLKSKMAGLNEFVQSNQTNMIKALWKANSMFSEHHCAFIIFKKNIK